MSRGELDAAIVLPQGFGGVGDKGYPTGQAEVIYNKSNEQGGQTLASILSSVLTGLTKVCAHRKPFTVAAKSTEKQGLTQFDYVFAGLLGFSLMAAGIFGPTNVFPKLKEKEFCGATIPQPFEFGSIL